MTVRQGNVRIRFKNTGRKRKFTGKTKNPDFSHEKLKRKPEYPVLPCENEIKRPGRAGAVKGGLRCST
jgi:hypothetical protein